MSFSSPDPWEALTVSIVGGNSNGVFAIDPSGVITVASPPSVPANYVLTVAVSDNAYPVSLVGTGYVNIKVLANGTPFHPGSISYALYDNIGDGNMVSDLTNNARFPRDPSSEKQMPTMEGDSDRAESYGSVMRGYLIPPQTGSYTFWIATDDNGELWMSTTTNPASMTRIAYISGSGNWASPRQWTKFSTQQSSPRTLIAGQGYYLEARQKEGGGGDNLAVAWKGPATANLTNVISGLFLAPFSLNYVPHATGFTSSLHQGAIAGTPVGTVVVSDVNAGDGHTFTITGGNSDGLFSIDAAAGTIRVADAAALAASPPASYILQVSVTDTGTPPLSTNATVTINVVATNAIGTSSVRREIFNGIGSGTAVSDLTGSAPYPGRPDTFETLSSFACAQDIGDNYGSRVRALLTPTSSGTYNFFIASDDASSLLLSPNSNSINATRVAYVSGYTSYNTWTSYASQRSAGIPLVAGQSYYIEALQKEGGGGDHLSVAWAGPGVVDGNGLAATNVIDGSFLSPVDINYPPKFTNQTVRVFNSVPNGALIGNVFAQDSPLDKLTYAIVAGNTNNMFALAPDTGALTVLDNTLITNGSLTSFPLSIVAQDSGYGGLYPVKSTQAAVTVSVVSTNGAFTWTGASSSSLWSSANNWGGIVPGAGAQLTFGSPMQQANSNDLVSSVANVIFNNAGFNLLGQPLTVQSGVRNSGNNAWSLNTTLGAAQTWQITAGTFTINGALTNAGFQLTLAANGDVQLNGPLSGAGGLTKSGTARLLLQGAQPYSGATTVASAGSSSTALQLSGPADLSLANSDLTMNGRMDLVNHNALVGALNGSGTIFANDIPRPVLTIGANGHSGTFTGVLLDNAAGLGVTLAVAKTGGGVQTFTGASVFTGGTVVRAGQITLANAAALGTGPVTLGDAGTGTNAVWLLASTATTYANSLSVSGQAAGTATIGTANISPGAVNTQFGGPLTLNRDVTLQAGSADRTTFAGQITGVGNLFVSSPYNSGRRVVLDRSSGVANSFIGNITLSSNAWLQVGVADSIANRCIPDSATVNFNTGGQLRFSPTGAGDSETLDTLNSLLPGAGTVDLISGTTFTLVLGGGNGIGWFSGNIANSVGTLAVTKAGAGTQALVGSNSFSGSLSINGGVLVAAANAALGAASAGTTVNPGASLALSNSIAISAEPLTLNGTGYAATGALRNDSGNNIFNGPITLGNASTLSTVTGTLILGNVLDTRGYTVTFDTASGAPMGVDGALGGTGGLVKAGAGLLTLNAANSYTGPTAIVGGTLALGSAGGVSSSSILGVEAGAVLDASALSTGLTIPAAQTLKGNGAVLGNVLVNGTLAPGASIGGLSFNNNLTLAGTTFLEINKIGTTLSNDFAAVAGTLTFGGTLIVTNTGQSLAPGDSFRLFPAGAYTGSFTNLTLPALMTSLRWDLSQLLVNGTLRVVSVTPPQLTAGLSSDGAFQLQILSETGVDYVLQSTTNVSGPVSWVSISTNTGNGGILVLNPPADPTQPQVFYRVIVY
ncbi:MAG: cadherin domain-containing protein [Verrucomicrobia bacterium]|nr:cadherin domain-containing protein [Verrucomicrobiota bacterium]